MHTISSSRLAAQSFLIFHPLLTPISSLSPLVQSDKIKARWEETTWAKKLSAKAKRASLTDFDRFKLMVARKEKAAIIKKHL